MHPPPRPIRGIRDHLPTRTPKAQQARLRDQIFLPSPIRQKRTHSFLTLGVTRKVRGGFSPCRMLPLLHKPDMLTLLASQSSAIPNSNPSDPSSSQGQLSQPERLSQTPAVPLFQRDRTDINSILNSPVPGVSRALATLQPQLLIDQALSANLLHNVVAQTSGCSIEQLEQVYSALMNEIWRTRGEWDRGKVALQLNRVFADVMTDIHSCQGLAAGSMEIES